LSTRSVRKHQTKEPISMSADLSDRLALVKPSQSMAARLRVDGLRAAGRKILDFTIGEPDLPTPAHIVASGSEAMASGKTRYTAPNGLLSLRQAIVDKFRRDNGLAYLTDEIVVGSGAKILIYLALTATLDPGDEVIVPAPYWVSYPDMVALHGGVPVLVVCDQFSGYKLGPAALEGAITARTKWLVLNSPNNPTGAVYDEREMAALAEVLRRHPHVRIMTDEIYEYFVYGGASHRSIVTVAPDLRARTLVVNGVSKAYAMTGWRIGYAAGPLPLVKAIGMLLSQSTSCAATPSQEAAVTALAGTQDCVANAVALFAQRRDRMLELINGIRGFRCVAPTGAFYLFPDVSGLIGAVTPEGSVIQNDNDVVLYLLDKGNVATIDGRSYGLPNHLRLSFATAMEEIVAGCQAIDSAVSALRFPSTTMNTESNHA
jgi:aspartate aminotransferase